MTENEKQCSETEITVKLLTNLMESECEKLSGDTIKLAREGR